MVGFPGESGNYTVDHLPRVTLQIRRLVARAKQLGLEAQTFDALETILAKLETKPLEWGDPEYSTKQGKGLVLHGLHRPFVVRYVVFQKKRVVCILDVRAFPHDPLEPE